MSATIVVLLEEISVKVMPSRITVGGVVLGLKFCQEIVSLFGEVV